MCRMVASPTGIPGCGIADPFLRMARGENATNEKNKTLGFVTHGDGWGGVVIERGEARRIRGAGSVWQDSAFDELRTRVVRLLHARRASRGPITESNSHPFSASIRGGTWFFCHNGTLRDEPEDGTAATDSERFFRRVVPGLEAGLDPVRAFEWAATSLRLITSLDSLLLGPNGLWAFCLWADPTCPAYYTLFWAETSHGVVVSSEPLADVASRWVPMQNGTVLCVPLPSGTPRTVELRLPTALTPAAA